MIEFNPFLVGASVTVVSILFTFVYVFAGNRALEKDRIKRAKEKRELQEEDSKYDYQRRVRLLETQVQSLKDYNAAKNAELIVDIEDLATQTETLTARLDKAAKFCTTVVTKAELKAALRRRK